jgi:taurine dioxygenase
MTAVEDIPRTAVKARPAAGYIGADISGIDISQPLSSQEAAEIQDALFRYKVIFFRDQKLTHASQVAFGKNFGELTYAHPHDEAPPNGHPEIFTVDTRRYEERYGKDFREEYRRRDHGYFTGWHTDVTAAVNPPAASILRADVVPEVGGDTQWTNLVAAYEGLSEPMKQFVSTLRAEHRYGGGDKARNGSYSKRVQDNLLVAIHPVVRVHPHTRERALFVNPGFTSHIVDLTARESHELLGLLYSEIARPEYTVRFRWEPGSVAFWDNRATAHLAPRDNEHLGARRTLHRVTVIGDVPVGPDGRESELVAGEKFTNKHEVVVSG